MKISRLKILVVMICSVSGMIFIRMGILSEKNRRDFEIDNQSFSENGSVKNRGDAEGGRWSPRIEPLVVVVLPFYLLCAQGALESFWVKWNVVDVGDTPAKLLTRTTMVIMVAAYVSWISRHFYTNMPMYFPDYFESRRQGGIDRLQFSGPKAYGHLFVVLGLFYILAIELAPPNIMLLSIVTILVFMDALPVIYFNFRPDRILINHTELAVGRLRKLLIVDLGELAVCIFVHIVWRNWSSDEIWHVLTTNRIFGSISNWPANAAMGCIWSLAAGLGIALMAWIRAKYSGERSGSLRAVSAP